MLRPGPFYAAGGTALALVPLAMALANRSSPVVVGLAALAFLAGRLVEDAAGTRRLLVSSVTGPVGLAALAFLGWCLASLAWSPFPALSLRVIGEFGPTLAAAVLLARLAPGRIPGFAAPLGALCVGAAGLIIAVGLALDLPIQRALGQRVAAFVYNRPALTLALLAGPLALVLRERRQRALAGAVLVLAALGILRSVSGAAALGAVAGVSMFALARLLPARPALGIAALALVLATALAPVEGDVLRAVMPEAIHQRLEHSSSRARVAIARSFGATVAAEPWVGAGYGVSARFAEAPVAGRVEPEMRVMLAVGHPHNSFLQVWAELGVVGAVLAAAVLMLGLRALARLPPWTRAAALALTATAASIAFVEHGAWAAWWTAGLGAAIAWLAEAARLERA